MSVFASIARRLGRGQAISLYSYQRPDGSFDYERYRAVQTAGNHRKLERQWAREPDIRFLAGVIRDRIPFPARFGLCHGTRRGMEQAWFSEALGCEVLGTEISDTAAQFANTIEWDFHNVKPEWIDAVDFIYSNALDHSYDPEKCLNAWMSCVRPAGLCVIEHSQGHGAAYASELDPFGAATDVMPFLVARWGKGRYAVREIIELPSTEKRRAVAFLIQRFSDSWPGG